MIRLTLLFVTVFAFSYGCSPHGDVRGPEEDNEPKDWTHSTKHYYREQEDRSPGQDILGQIRDTDDAIRKAKKGDGVAP